MLPGADAAKSGVIPALTRNCDVTGFRRRRARSPAPSDLLTWFELTGMMNRRTAVKTAVALGMTLATVSGFAGPSA